MVRVEFPTWFYSALAIAGIVPLVKARLTPEQAFARQDPDVRPVAVQWQSFCFPGIHSKKNSLEMTK